MLELSFFLIALGLITGLISVVYFITSDIAEWGLVGIGLSAIVEALGWLLLFYQLANHLLT